MTTVFIPEIVMFSFPLVFALIGSEHQDYRYANYTPLYDICVCNLLFEIKKMLTSKLALTSNHINPIVQVSPRLWRLADPRERGRHLEHPLRGLSDRLVLFRVLV